MKFCDKLPKLRKDNNLSQEKLADLLGVSRQAVSKWESGSSYPDMEKLNKLCKILNCTLEDLLDDGSISKTNKVSFNTYINDFLKLITNIYNMFFAMGLKEKIKCLLEMLFIILVLWVLSFIVFTFCNSFIFNLFLNIPKLGVYIDYILENITMIILFIIDLIIFIHLFKIRYLDYYITVEDQNIKEKQIEKEKINKERIIIRDPKHSSFSIFNMLASIIVVVLKILFVILLLFISFFFICLLVFLILAIYHIKYSILFIFVTSLILGVLLINYDLIYLAYNFIFSRKQNIKRVFIIFISGLFVSGVSLGLILLVYLSFDKENEMPSSFKNDDIVTVKMEDNLIIHNDDVVYKIDNSIKDIEIKNSFKGAVVEEDYMYSSLKEYKVIYFKDDSNVLLELLFEDIKNSKTRDYSKVLDDSIVISVSLDNYNKLCNNYTEYINDN